MDLNKVMIIGRTTASPELKENNGNKFLNFTIATNRKYKNKEGNLVEEAEFHKIVAFGKMAETISKYTEKGVRIYVEGRLKTRKWEDNTGKTNYATEIVCENVIFIDSTKNGSGADTGVETTNDANDEEIPF